MSDYETGSFKAVRFIKIKLSTLSTAGCNFIVMSPRSLYVMHITQELIETTCERQYTNTAEVNTLRNSGRYYC